MIKNLFSKKTLRYPFWIVVLSALIASVLYVLATLLYLPTTNDLDEKISLLEQQLKQVDQELRLRKSYEKNIRRYNELMELKSNLNVINSSFAEILEQILNLDKDNNSLASIYANENSTLIISVEAKNRPLLYSLIEDIENQPIVNRVTVTNTPENKQIILSLFLSKNTGGAE